MASLSISETLIIQTWLKLNSVKILFFDYTVHSFIFSGINPKLIISQCAHRIANPIHVSHKIKQTGKIERVQKLI